jgi:prepilin-type N-terminal cleavage/methylation domain-containing protein
MRSASRRLRAAEDGFTLPEMLVVLVILGIVLAGLTQLFTGSLVAEKDQTNRTEAQQDGRLALDKLRREIHCASSVAPTSGGYPTSSVTIRLGSWCPTSGGTATTVTWCTKGAAQPYTLWRYSGGSCSGAGTQWASSLVDSTSPSVTAGKIFNGASVAAPSLTATTGGTLLPGTYTYEVTAVLAGGAEVPGVVAGPLTVASGQNAVNVSWSAYPGAASYDVYGRGTGGIALLKNVTVGTSWVDKGPTSLSPASPATSVTLPAATIPVADTSNFSSGANTIVFGASGLVSCTGTTSTSFTGCSGGQPGQYPKGMPVDSVSSSRPPLTALSVTLPVDTTPADARQRFVVADDIVLRNSRP